MSSGPRRDVSVEDGFVTLDIGTGRYDRTTVFLEADETRVLINDLVDAYFELLAEGIPDE